MNRYAVVSGEYNIVFTQPKTSIVISNGASQQKLDYNKFKSFIILPKTEKAEIEEE
jgi:hypothetical protein